MKNIPGTLLVTAFSLKVLTKSTLITANLTWVWFLTFHLVVVGTCRLFLIATVEANLIFILVLKKHSL